MQNPIKGSQALAFPEWPEIDPQGPMDSYGSKYPKWHLKKYEWDMLGAC
jgi:hypothetical protein